MIKAVSVTDVGKRRQLNQDIVFASEQALGRLPNVFIVADGMGGHNAGEIASNITIDYLRDEFEKKPKLGTKVEAVTCKEVPKL